MNTINVPVEAKAKVSQPHFRRPLKPRRNRRRQPRKPPHSPQLPNPPNHHEFRCETATTSVPAKKLKTHSAEVPISVGLGYRLINFLAFFSTLSEMIKCKYCDGNVTFSESSICGLGFKLVVTCNNCEPRYINSCPLINRSDYEINTRIVFAMRLLGVGYEGIKKFCGIMDLSKAFNKKVYDDIMTNVHCALKAVTGLIFSEAAAEEKWLTDRIRHNPTLTANAGNTLEPAGLVVYGNGTWRKNGFSLQNITTLIGHYSGKMIDLIIKLSDCKQCEHWKNKMDTEEYETWKDLHKDDCFIDHEESPGKMEVEGTVEMFARSEGLHGVKYLSYIGDGDSETFKGITESQPYGENIKIKKKECIGHVQKRMSARLRKVKKDTKGLDGEEKLTGNLIDELSVYYGLAIIKNKDSTEGMSRAIWATLQHKSSTDANPQHDNCPPGPDSWCTWQKAKADNKLNEYTHTPALPDVVFNAIIPVYEVLTEEGLLQRCLGGFTRSKNGSFNSLIWSYAPKRIKTIEIAAYIAACIFNKGYASIPLMMHRMNLVIGPNTAALCEQQDEIQVSISEARTFEAPEEGQIEQQRISLAIEDIIICKEEGPSHEVIIGD